MRCFHWGRKIEGQLTIFLTSVPKETLQKVNTERRTETGMVGRGVSGVGGRGLQPPHPKKTCFFILLFFRSAEFYYIYTYEYIDNTADKGVCRSIHSHYIDSYYGRRDRLSVCRLSRKRLVGPGQQRFCSSALAETSQKPVGVCACWPWPPEVAPCWAAFCFSMVQSNV